MILEQQYPFLLTREQASEFLGVDPKSFDKYIRKHPNLKRFMIGRQERFLKDELILFIQDHLSDN
ncbi:helix-turn-helix domain-containing protein [Enterococcus sp. BWB1-3]|uniref:helix-turn-helix domain-containing protein n=1 Tax=Enterococcus sp. BWB1-3 TaxID=2787713 RepID=UPI001920879F|nr:helix-turn-helix domain-containing protein [Enterococcus sp. BWB1-3]MBL1229302.1 helix-turn-helix domain-containing protein [Enterococcus sp. BWB1-3]